MACHLPQSRASEIRLLCDAALVQLCYEAALGPGWNDSLRRRPAWPGSYASLSVNVRTRRSLAAR
jgi:hypothetical protein